MTELLDDYRFFERLFGLSWDDASFWHAIDAADIDYERDAVFNDAELSLLEQAGFEIYFSEDPAAPAKLVFSGVRFVRTGDLRSIGYRGGMPFGIAFSDSVPTVVSRVGREPDFREADETDRCEYLHWNLAQCRLHVLFDQDDGLAARITLLAPAPYYADWDSPFAI